MSEAVLKSSLIKDIAMSAASIYGGPVGTAAFTAWYTYKVTGGDLEAALKAGVIAGLSSAGMGISKEIPYTELTRRTLATATVGAAAVAAAGGSEEDIIRGFLTGTAMTLASSYYAKTVGRNMDGRVASREPIDKFAPKHQDYYGVFTDKDGKPVLFYDAEKEIFYTKINTNNIAPEISQVSIATRGDASIIGAIAGETAIPMRLLTGGIPMMNAMSAFHDRMCDVLAIDSKIEVALTIVPASILTVATSQVPLQSLLLATLTNGERPALRRDEDGYLVIEPLIGSSLQ